MPDAEAGPRRAWGWVAALQDGSTATWAQWREHGVDAERGGRFLPGAQQLELLRRLNADVGADGTVGSDASVPQQLVQRVVSASAPGRGRPDLELVGAVPLRTFGPRPVDPTDLDDDELLRVATSLLAEDVVTDASSDGAAADPAPGLLRPWRRAYRLLGAPWLAEPLRAELRRRGRPPGGVRPTVLLVGADLATMTALAFTARAFDEGGSAWSDWLGALVTDQRVPPRADLPRLAGRWTRARLVLDPRPELVVGRLLRTRGLPAAPVVPADGVDLARRVGAPLGLLVLPEERRRLLRRVLLPRLVADGGPPLAVPSAHLPWLTERAVRMQHTLASAGYAVDGDQGLGRLLPHGTDVAHGSEPDSRRVLGLALRLLLRREGGRKR